MSTNRQIKFRAWIPDIERMYSVNSIEVNPADNATYKKLVVWEHPSERAAKIKRKLGVFRLTDDIPIMQFTGLKDINGVEIYEGDIVKWGHIEGSEERIHRMAIVKINPDIQFQTFNLGEYDQSFHFGNFAYRRTDKALEVLGNIHQNYELLEVA